MSKTENQGGITKTPVLSRRAVLRGLGVTMALPWLEAMAGTGRVASGAAGLLPVGRMIPEAAPVRMAFVFAPNGVNFPAWMPSGTGVGTGTMGGAGFDLSPTLEPLAPVRGHVNILTGLTLDKARANGDGPGDHARSSASFLTGAQARKTAGNDIRIGVSVDQFAAQQVGLRTRLPSLEVGCENGQPAGNCDSGYSCAYSSNIAWRDEDTPVPKMIDPWAVFERLFGHGGDGGGGRGARLRRRASVLDFVLDDTARLERRLGADDRRKLDGFQTSVREVERRVARARSEAEAPRQPAPDDAPPAGIPHSITEHIDLMYDMMLLAFRMDVTRISTFALATEGTNRTIPEIGVKEGHHHLSHHQGNEGMVEQIRRIDRFYIERFAGFVGKLAATPEGDRSLLDNCMVLYGCGIGDGNRHNHDDLPILLAGRGGGAAPAGRLVASAPETPLCNLYVSMLERMGCDIGSFGDSTGPLTGLG